MTFVARIELARDPARRLAEAIGNNADLDWPTVALSEISEDRWSVEVYFETRPGPAEKAALKRLAERFGSFTIAPLPNLDWVAESLKGLKPVRAGRFLVHGRHDRHVLRPNDIGIEIEAGEAFGTGHHGTTTGCLLEIDRLARIRGRRRVLDVGTGSGILAIAMAKRWHAPTVATDIDAVAVRVAASNIRLNGATRIRTIVAAGLAHADIRHAGPYDVIVANILARPLEQMSPSIARLLRSDGVAVYSGILTGQRARIIAACRSSGLRLVRAVTLDGWLTLTFSPAARPRPKIRAEKVRGRRSPATYGRSRMSPAANRRSRAVSR